VYKNLIPEDDILCRINQVIDFSFVNEECSDLYSPNSGRPVTNTPERMFRSAIVQYLNDFSDRQMERAARYDIIIKWFIGVPIEDRSYDHSALGDFRDRLGEERWKKLFFIILNQIEDAGFAKGTQSVEFTIANPTILDDQYSGSSPSHTITNSSSNDQSQSNSSPSFGIICALLSLALVVMWKKRKI